MTMPDIFDQMQIEEELNVLNQNGGSDVNAGAGAKMEHDGSGFPQRHALSAKNAALNRHMLPPWGSSPQSLLNDRFGKYNPAAVASEFGTFPYILLWLRSNSYKLFENST